MRGTVLSVLIASALLLPVAALAQTPHVAPPPPGWNPAAQTAPTSAAAVPGSGSTVAAPAQTHAAATPSVPVPSGDLDYLSERSRLSEQVQILELKAKIADLQKKINGDTGSSEVPAAVSLPVPPVPMSSSPVASIKVPVHPVTQTKTTESAHLIGVVRIGTSSRAVVSENGSNYKVGVGSALPSGWHVSAITSASVSMVRGRAHRTLLLGE